MTLLLRKNKRDQKQIIEMYDKKETGFLFI